MSGAADEAPGRRPAYALSFREQLGALAAMTEALLRRGGAVALVVFALLGAFGATVAGALLLAAVVSGRGSLLPVLGPTAAAVILACLQAGPLAAFGLALEKTPGFEESFRVALRSLGWLLLLAHASLIPLGIALAGYVLVLAVGPELLGGARIPPYLAWPILLLAVAILNLGVQMHARSFVLTAAVIVSERPGLVGPLGRAHELARGHTAVLFAATLVPLLVAFAAAPNPQVAATAERILSPATAELLQTAGRGLVLAAAVFAHALLASAVLGIARGTPVPGQGSDAGEEGPGPAPESSGPREA